MQITYLPDWTFEALADELLKARDKDQILDLLMNKAGLSPERYRADDEFNGARFIEDGASPAH